MPSTDLSRTVRAIPTEQRLAFIESLPERDLHVHLKSLLEKKLPGATVEITHGSQERGADLIVVRDDQLGETTLGFIVERGTIGGSVSGPVDEIVNKARQVKMHPARLKAIVGPKKVDQAVVVVAGRVSKGASVRIEREVKPFVREIWDVKKLVEEFTMHYPQVFFDAPTVDYLQARITELESQRAFHGLAKSVNLSEWFVEPIVGSNQPLEGLGTDRPLSGRHTYSFVQLKHVLEAGKRVLLVGSPGSGKSAAVAKVALDILKEGLVNATVGKSERVVAVPTFVTAKEMLSYENVDALLADKCQGAKDGRFRVCVLLIDGLDEVRHSHWGTIIERALAFSDSLNCSLVITTRWLEALSDPVKGLQQVELLPFHVNQAVKLFQRLVSDQKVLDSLQKGLNQIQNQLQMVPLTLVMLIEVVREQQEIPASVTELYDRFFDYAFGRHDPTDKGIEVLFEYRLKKRLLSQLAFELFYEKNRFDIDRAEFEAFCRRFAERQDLDQAQAPQFVEEVERAGILNIGDTVYFCHRSFLDYFTALRISERSYEPSTLTQMLKQMYFDPRWTEVVFFYVGLKREAEQELMTSIFGVESEDVFDQVMKLLSGRLLQAGWLSDAEIKKSAVASAASFAPAVRDGIVNIVFENPTAGHSVLATAVVEMLGAHSFGSIFLKNASENAVKALLEQPSYDNITSTLAVLGGLRRQIQGPEMREYINAILGSLGACGLSAQAEAGVLLSLMLLSGEEKRARRSLERRLQRLIQRNQALKDALPVSRPKVGRPKRRRKSA